MIPELQPLLDQLPTAWVAAFWKLATFVGAVRLFAKPLCFRLQAWLSAKVALAVASSSKEDDSRWLRLLSHPAYRFVNFWVFDTLLSVKLPTEDSLVLHEVKTIEEPAEEKGPLIP